MAYVTLEELCPGAKVINWSDPERGNALSQELADEFSEAVAKIRRNPPRVVVITGKGATFSTAGDSQLLIRQSDIVDPRQRNLTLRNFYASFLFLLKIKVPIIAAINGDATGPGFFLTCACDYRVADENARLGCSTLRYGRYPVLGATLTLPRLVGPGKALEIFCGEPILAPEARQIGLIERIAPAGKVMDEARKLAIGLIQAAPFPVEILLTRLRPNEEEFAAAIRHETDSLTQCLGRGEYKEALKAREENRQPRWVPT